MSTFFPYRTLQIGRTPTKSHDVWATVLGGLCVCVCVCVCEGAERDHHKGPSKPKVKTLHPPGPGVRAGRCGGGQRGSGVPGLKEP